MFRTRTSRILTFVGLLALGTAFAVGAAPAKKGGVAASVRFEIGNPLTSLDAPERPLQPLDLDRLMRTEALRMVDASTLKAACDEHAILQLEIKTPADLRQFVRAEPVPGTYFVDLIASASNEADASAIARSVADVYWDRFAGGLGKMRRDRIEQLEDLIKHLSRDIEQIDERMEALIAKQQIMFVERTPHDPKILRAQLWETALQNAEEALCRLPPLPEAEAEHAAAQGVVDELMERRRWARNSLEDEAQARMMLEDWRSARAAKVQRKESLQSEVMRERLTLAASPAHAYPGIRRVDGQPVMR